VAYRYLACRYLAVDRWNLSTIGSTRFPTLSLLARDTIMIKGSSVPSESAFSDSGHFVTANRASLTDDNICKMMKLRSWKRLLMELST
jgi:hAT family C-terminal dimerisation region